MPRCLSAKLLQQGRDAGHSIPSSGHLVPGSRYIRLGEDAGRTPAQKGRQSDCILPGEGDLLVFMPIPIAQLYAILLYILHVYNPIVQSFLDDLVLSASIGMEVSLLGRTSRWACGKCDRLSFEVDQAILASRRGTWTITLGGGE